MALKSQIDAALNKKMDRQGFLKNLALILVTVSGIGTALRLVAGSDKRSDQTYGYGSSAYGGEKTHK